MGKRKDPHKVAEGLARGLSQRRAVEEAGYSALTAEKKGYAIVKRSLVQSALTDAAERLGVTFDKILKPVVEALEADLVVRTTEGALKTKLPDHRIRLEAHDRLVNLYGGKPRETEMPASPAPGLTVIIKRKESGPSTKPAVDVTPKGHIEARGTGINPPLNVRIIKAKK